MKDEKAKSKKQEIDGLRDIVQSFNQSLGDDSTSSYLILKSGGNYKIVGEEALIKQAIDDLSEELYNNKVESPEQLEQRITEKMQAIYEASDSSIISINNNKKDNKKQTLNKSKFKQISYDEFEEKRKKYFDEVVDLTSKCSQLINNFENQYVKTIESIDMFKSQREYAQNANNINLTAEIYSNLVKEYQKDAQKQVETLRSYLASLEKLATTEIPKTINNLKKLENSVSFIYGLKDEEKVEIVDDLQRAQIVITLFKKCADKDCEKERKDYNQIKSKFTEVNDKHKTVLDCLSKM